MTIEPQSERASDRRWYELLVRKTSSSPIAVPMSDMGTGDVRGSSTAGSREMRYAHAAATRLIGSTALSTVLYRHERAVAIQRLSGGRSV